MAVDAAIGEDPRELIGNLSEYQRLLTGLGAQPGVLMLAADPLSGATGVLRHALSQLVGHTVYLDARDAIDERDLALILAGSAVDAIHPEAAAWWMRSAPDTDRAGLRLARGLTSRGVAIDALRGGEGRPARLLDIALDLASELAQPAGVTVAIDHLDGVAEPALSTLRAASQRRPELQLVLVGRTDGPVDRAVRDPGHALFRGAQLERLHRSPPDRFAKDMAVARPWTDVPVDSLRRAAELAAASPGYVWGILDLARELGAGGDQREVVAWTYMRRLAAPHTSRRFDELRAVHPIAQAVYSMVAAGSAVYSLPFNAGRVRAALNTLRDIGAVWQPNERRWAASDPLLAAWSRERVPHWRR